MLDCDRFKYRVTGLGRHNTVQRETGAVQQSSVLLLSPLFSTYEHHHEYVQPSGKVRLAGLVHFSCHDEMRSKDYFSAKLDAMPEPSRMEKRFIQGFFRFLPQVFLYGVKMFAKGVVEDIPAIPAGRPGPDAYFKLEVIAEMGKKIVLGYTAKQAKKQMARKFALSEGTIQRI